MNFSLFFWSLFHLNSKVSMFALFRSARESKADDNDRGDNEDDDEDDDDEDDDEAELLKELERCVFQSC